MKIALVHDYLTQLGGGEKVLAALGEMFKEAPVFTLIYDAKATNGVFKGRKIHTSFLQKIPAAKKWFRGLIWLAPLAIEQFDLSDFDLVISVSHSYGKGIITKPGTKHICYCLTPTRYLWHDAGLPFKFFSRPILTYLRNWDYQAAQRPDYMIAVSEAVQRRITKYYGREAEIIYPPVDKPLGSNSVRSFSRPQPAAPRVLGLSPSPSARDRAERPAQSARRTTPDRFIDGYFLAVGRLVPYKRFDIAVDAFAKLPSDNLVIIGEGPEFKKLKIKIQKSKLRNIRFLERVSNEELAEYYANCRALIFPQEEDFGLVPLEAMAFGKPVIAYRAGGALETVREGETGVFFDKQTPQALAAAVRNFDPAKFDPEKIKNWAAKFDKEVFKKKIRDFLANLT